MATRKLGKGYDSVIDFGSNDYKKFVSESRARSQQDESNKQRDELVAKAKSLVDETTQRARDAKADRGTGFLSDASHWLKNTVSGGLHEKSDIVNDIKARQKVYEEQANKAESQGFKDFATVLRDKSKQESYKAGKGTDQITQEAISKMKQNQKEVSAKASQGLVGNFAGGLLDMGVGIASGLWKPSVASAPADQGQVIDESKAKEMRMNNEQYKAYTRIIEGGRTGNKQPAFEEGNVKASVPSTTFKDDNGFTVLIPLVSPQGEPINEQQAIDNYKATGKNLGKFGSEEEANLRKQYLSDSESVKLDPSKNAYTTEESKTIEAKIKDIGSNKPEDYGNSVPLTNTEITRKAQANWDESNKEGWGVTAGTDFFKPFKEQLRPVTEKELAASMANSALFWATLGIGSSVSDSLVKAMMKEGALNAPGGIIDSWAQEDMSLGNMAKNVSIQGTTGAVLGNAKRFGGMAKASMSGDNAAFTDLIKGKADAQSEISKLLSKDAAMQSSQEKASMIKYLVSKGATMEDVARLGNNIKPAFDKLRAMDDGVEMPSGGPETAYAKPVRQDKLENPGNPANRAANGVLPQTDETLGRVEQVPPDYTFGEPNGPQTPSIPLREGDGLGGRIPQFDNAEQAQAIYTSIRNKIDTATKNKTNIDISPKEHDIVVYFEGKNADFGPYVSTLIDPGGKRVIDYSPKRLSPEEQLAADKKSMIESGANPAKRAMVAANDIDSITAEIEGVKNEMKTQGIWDEENARPDVPVNEAPVFDANSADNLLRQEGNPLVAKYNELQANLRAAQTEYSSMSKYANMTKEEINAELGPNQYQDNVINMTPEARAKYYAEQKALNATLPPKIDEATLTDIADNSEGMAAGGDVNPEIQAALRQMNINETGGASISDSEIAAATLDKAPAKTSTKQDNTAKIQQLLELKKQKDALDGKPLDPFWDDNADMISKELDSHGLTADDIDPEDIELLKDPDTEYLPKKVMQDSNEVIGVNIHNDMPMVAHPEFGEGIPVTQGHVEITSGDVPLPRKVIDTILDEFSEKGGDNIELPDIDEGAFTYLTGATKIGRSIIRRSRAYRQILSNNETIMAAMDKVDSLTKPGQELIKRHRVWQRSQDDFSREFVSDMKWLAKNEQAKTDVAGNGKLADSMRRLPGENAPRLISDTPASMLARNMMTNMRAKLQSVGVKLGWKEDYLPRNMRPGMADNLMNFIVDNADRKMADGTKLGNAFNRIVEKRGESNAMIVYDGPTRSAAEFKRIDELGLPEDLRDQYDSFFISDPIENMVITMEGMGKTYADAVAWGPNLKEYNRLLIEVRRANPEKLIFDDTRTLGDQFVDQLKTLRQATINPASGDWLNRLRSAQVITKMQLAGITNLSQTTNTAVLHGAGNTSWAIKEYAKIKMNKEASQALLDRAASYGLNLTTIIEELEGMTTGSMAKSKILSSGATDEALSKLADLSLTWNGFKEIEVGNRLVAMMATEKKLLKIISNMTEGKMPVKADASYLQTIGISLDEINAKGGITKDMYDAAVLQGVAKTQFYTAAKDLAPLVSKNAYYKTAAQLGQFSMKQTEFLKDAVLREVPKVADGDLRHLLPLFRYLTIGVPVGAGVRWIKGVGIAMLINAAVSPFTGGKQFIKPKERETSLAEVGKNYGDLWMNGYKAWNYGTESLNYAGGFGYFDSISSNLKYSRKSDGSIDLMQFGAKSLGPTGADIYDFMGTTGKVGGGILDALPGSDSYGAKGFGSTKTDWGAIGEDATKKAVQRIPFVGPIVKQAMFPTNPGYNAYYDLVDRVGSIGNVTKGDINRFASTVKDGKNPSETRVASSLVGMLMNDKGELNTYITADKKKRVIAAMKMLDIDPYKALNYSNARKEALSTVTSFMSDDEKALKEMGSRRASEYMKENGITIDEMPNLKVWFKINGDQIE